MRGIDTWLPIVLATSSSTVEPWWDALECGIDEILPGHPVLYRLCQLLETRAVHHGKRNTISILQSLAGASWYLPPTKNKRAR